MKRLLLALALILPCPAVAAEWSGTCQFAANNITPLNPTRFTIDNGVVGCYRFQSADSTLSSAIFVVSADTALVCFDPRNDAITTTAARVTLHRCPVGVGGATGSVNTCIDTGGFKSNATLDGTEGTDGTQNACKRVGPGTYFIRVTVASTMSGSNYSEVSIKGEHITN